MTNETKYRDIFLELFSITPDDLEPNFTFADNEQWDSLAHLELISELEEVFEVMFETDDILNYGSYNNGKLILQRYGVDIT